MPRTFQLCSVAMIALMRTPAIAFQQQPGSAKSNQTERQRTKEEVPRDRAGESRTRGSPRTCDASPPMASLTT